MCSCSRLANRPASLPKPVSQASPSHPTDRPSVWKKWSKRAQDINCIRLALVERELARACVAHMRFVVCGDDCIISKRLFHRSTPPRNTLVVHTFTHNKETHHRHRRRLRYGTVRKKTESDSGQTCLTGWTTQHNTIRGTCDATATGPPPSKRAIALAPTLNRFDSVVLCGACGKTLCWWENEKSSARKHLSLFEMRNGGVYVRPIGRRSH